MAFTSQRRDPCAEVSLAMLKCHDIHGKSGEECVREELLFKRCHADLLCQPDAQRFYKDRIRGSGSEASCSTLLERFAFQENELFLTSELVDSKHVKTECRKVARDLAKCMSNRYGSARTRS
jgi:hypothetical protein